MGGGGGGVLRAVGRAIGAGGIGPGPGSVPNMKPKPSQLLTVPFSSSSSSSSSPNTSFSLPVPANTLLTNGCRFVVDEVGNDWVTVNEHNGHVVSASSHRNVFGPVPSKEEVQNAVSTIQRAVAYNQSTNATDFRQSVLSTNIGIESDNPTLQLCNPNATQANSFDHVFDSFRLLQTNPSIQRMVVSLSSDEAIWNAVMNNEAVKELKESFYAAENNHLESSEEEEPQVGGQFLKWILDNTKAKISEVLDKFMKLMNDLFNPREPERAKDILEDTVWSSLMLSFMVLLVVVVTRVQKS